MDTAFQKSGVPISLQGQLRLLEERVLIQQRQISSLQSDLRSHRSQFIVILFVFLCFSIIFQFSFRHPSDSSHTSDHLRIQSLEANLSSLSTEISHLSTEFSHLSTEFSLLSTEFSLLSTDFSLLSTNLSQIKSFLTPSLSESELNEPQIPITPPIKPQSSSQNSIECPFRGLNRPLHGIIRYLTQSALGNVHERGFVQITGYGPNSWPSSVPEVVDLDSDDCWLSPSGVSSTLIFEFMSRNVTLTHYTLKSRKTHFYWRDLRARHPTKWKLEGSVNGEKWNLIDSRETGELDRAGKIACFPVSQSGSFRYLRFCFEHQPFESEYYHIKASVTVAAVEFFGELQSVED